MKRAVIKLTIDAPPGGFVDRMLCALSDMGYSVREVGRVPGTSRVTASVAVPYGEEGSLSYFYGAGRKKGDGT